MSERNSEGFRPEDMKDNDLRRLEEETEILELDEEHKEEVDDYLEQLKEHYLNISGSEKEQLIVKMRNSINSDNVSGPTRVVIRNFLAWVKSQETGTTTES